MRDALDREHRKALDLVVVAGVVAERALDGGLVRMCIGLMAFEHDLGAGRHLQVVPRHFTSSVVQPRSRPANWYSDSVSGTGVTAPRIVAGSAPSATATGNGSPGIAQRVIAEIERAAAMREPAHDHLVAADHLLAVDAEVLPRLVRPRVTVRPQVISGPASPGQQVWIGKRARSTAVPFQHDLLAGRATIAPSAPCPAPA